MPARDAFEAPFVGCPPIDTAGKRFMERCISIENKYVNVLAGIKVINGFPLVPYISGYAANEKARPALVFEKLVCLYHSAKTTDCFRRRLRFKRLLQREQLLQFESLILRKIHSLRLFLGQAHFLAQAEAHSHGFIISAVEHALPSRSVVRGLASLLFCYLLIQLN